MCKGASIRSNNQWIWPKAADINNPGQVISWIKASKAFNTNHFVGDVALGIFNADALANIKALAFTESRKSGVEMWFAARLHPCYWTGWRNTG